MHRISMGKSEDLISRSPIQICDFGSHACDPVTHSPLYFSSHVKVCDSWYTKLMISALMFDPKSRLPKPEILDPRPVSILPSGHEFQYSNSWSFFYLLNKMWFVLFFSFILLSKCSICASKLRWDKRCLIATFRWYLNVFPRCIRCMRIKAKAIIVIPTKI